jgi:predicted lipoprotein with Yx(FWY)xxD motif
MFENEDIPPPTYCLNHSYPTSIVEPIENYNNQTDLNSNDADDEGSIVYCYIHDAYHPSGCYQNCDNSNSINNTQSSPLLGGNGDNNSQFANDTNRADGLFSDDMDCSL